MLVKKVPAFNHNHEHVEVMQGYYPFDLEEFLSWNLLHGYLHSNMLSDTFEKIKKAE